jgi:hypothetical protein
MIFGNSEFTCEVCKNSHLEADFDYEGNYYDGGIIACPTCGAKYKAYIEEEFCIVTEKYLPELKHQTLIYNPNNPT